MKSSEKAAKRDRDGSDNRQELQGEQDPLPVSESGSAGDMHKKASKHKRDSPNGRQESQPEQDRPSVTKSGNTTDVRKQATERRRWIIEYIRTRRQLSGEDLKAKYPNLTRQSLDKDIKFLNDLGIYIQMDDSGCYVDTDAPHNEDTRIRLNLNQTPKTMVAQFVHSLLMGYCSEERSIRLGRYSKSEIDGMISKANRICKSSADRLHAKLIEYWSDPVRFAALDAGTTNQYVADQLSHLHQVIEEQTPFEDTELCSLNICTNSRLIFEKLGQPTVPIRTIIVGGAQRGRTSTIAGAMAEYFLRGAALLQFGITVVGATNVATETGLCYSDSQEEAILKGIMFGKSGIRVIAIDDSKISDRSMRGGYVFSHLSSDLIDLIVTNKPTLPGGQSKGKDFEQNIEMIRARGIPVIVANKLPSGNTNTRSPA
jgi:DeoR/GlpR family transcriptional regulator of sugar metabolism